MDARTVAHGGKAPYYGPQVSTSVLTSKCRTMRYDPDCNGFHDPV
jgi:hypothetical protein